MDLQLCSFPFFPLLSFQSLRLSINRKHPKKDLVSTSDTYFERLSRLLKFCEKAALKQKATSQMVKSFQKIFEILLIFSKAKGILQQRNFLSSLHVCEILHNEKRLICRWKVIDCMCVKFCTMKKDWSADGRWLIAFDYLPAIVIWPWWWYLYNNKIVFYLSVLFIPTSSKPNNFTLFIIIVLFLSLIDLLQICNIKVSFA
jgi:hypothetical protein